MTATGGFEVRVLPPGIADDRMRLRAEVTSPALGDRELWFEVGEARAGAVTDRADPFVVSTLLLAMAEGADLHVSGAPVDPVLRRNLVEFQRIWSAWFGYDTVEIHAEVAPAGNPAPASVVAFSGGADSAFSAWWHASGRAGPDRPLRGAMMIHGIDIPVTETVGFAGAVARSRRMVDSLGLELAVVATNAWTLPVPIGHFTGMGVAAALHVLGGQFGAGLVPSTATYRDLVVPLNTSPVSDWLLGSSRFEIVHDGARYNRLEKLRFLSEWPEAMDSLRVCLDDPRHDRNCGVCHKCMMTLAAFRVLGVEPRCFDRMPTGDELRGWARTLPSRPYYLQEGSFLLAAAAERDVDEPWVRTLRRRVRTAYTKQAVRAAWPGLADGAASLHRRARSALPTRR